MSKKYLVTKTKQGSWIVFWLLVIICFPLAILYWLFKLKKIKEYKYENKIKVEMEE